MQNTLKLLLMGSCVLAVVGCAHANSIHRLNGIRTKGQIEFVDAKQRAVLVVPHYKYKTELVPTETVYFGDNPTTQTQPITQNTPAPRRISTQRPLENNKKSIGERLAAPFTSLMPGNKSVKSNRTHSPQSNMVSNNPSQKNITSLRNNYSAATVLESLSYRVCSEPPPDVFSVFAMGLAGTGSLFPEGADAKAKRAELAVSLATSESGSTIERTQTINLLRESMFRTCERFMNGAIDEETMQIQSARDQRAMVAILAIEQLTGVVRRAPTIITAEAVSQISEDSHELLEKVEKKEKAVTDAQADVKAKKKAFDDAEKKYATLNAKKEGEEQGKCDILIAGEQLVGGTGTGGSASGGSGANGTAGSTSEGSGANGAGGGGAGASGAVVVPAAGSTVVTPASGGMVVVPPTDGTDGTAPSGGGTIVAPAGGSAVVAPAGSTVVVPSTPAASAATPVEPELTKEQCETAKNDIPTKKAALEASEKTLKEAEESLEYTKKLLERYSGMMSRTTAGGSGDPGDTRAGEQHLSNVANTVEEITRLAFNDDTEMVYMCANVIRKFGNYRNPSDVQENIVNMCLKLVEVQTVANAAKEISGYTQGYENVNKIMNLLDMAMSENGSTIERTGTIDLLRESNYRLIEGILNDTNACFVNKINELRSKPILQKFFYGKVFYPGRLKDELREGFASEETQAVVEVCR